MSQGRALISELKHALRARGLTYGDVAAHLAVSEATIKRAFAKNRFTLDRLEDVCDFAGLEISDLVAAVEARRGWLSELSEEQELSLVSDEKRLMVAFLMINGWPRAAISRHFRISDKEIEKHLLALDRLRIIELQPGGRVRLLTTRNFNWRENGPVQRLFRDRLQSEYFDSSFQAPGEVLRFVVGTLTPTSIAKLHSDIDRVGREFDELSANASGLPIAERYSCCAVLSLRPMDFSIFARHRRVAVTKSVPIAP